MNIFYKRLKKKAPDFKISLYLTLLMLCVSEMVRASGYSSSAVAQVTGNVSPASVNQQIVVVTANGSSSGLGQDWKINTCSFTMNNTSNANVTDAKLWMASTNSFGSATQVGSTIPNPTGTIVFTVNSGSIGNNSRYLFLTFSIAAGSPCSGNTVDAFVPSGGLVIGSAGIISGGNSGNKTPSPNDPSGNRQIFLQVTPSISIASSGGSVCQGSAINFTATPVNGGSTPAFQWKVNGINSGTNSNTFNSSTLTNNSQVVCVLTSNASCASPVTATSNTITVSINNNPKPKLTPSDTVLCTGSFFTMVARDTGAYVNGYPAGTIFDFGFGPSTDSTFFVNGPGQYTVTVTLPSGSGSCSAVSTVANYLFIDAPVAVMSADSVSCSGQTTANVYAQIFLGSVPFRFKWYHDGIVVKDTISSVAADTLKSVGAGTYCLVVSDSVAGLESILVCASDSACIDVGSPQQITISSETNNISCVAAGDGAINITASGGVPPYAFVWSNGASTEDISLLQPGTYTVTVTDLKNCSTNSSVSVITTVDITQPVLNCPMNIVVNVEPGICAATVNYVTPSGSDNCPGVNTVQTAGLSSGSVFPMGITTNTFVSSDSAGNVTVCSFTITVTDVELPVIACPSNVVQANDAGSCGAVITYSQPVATDNCSLAGLIQTTGLASGSAFPVGTTVNTFQATDASNNVSYGSFTVTVADNIKPVITSISDTMLVNDISACGAMLNYAVTATDNCSAVISQLAGFPSGSLFPIGITNNVFVATDPAGNTDTCSFQVTVTDMQSPVVITQDISLVLDATGTLIVDPMMVDAGSTDNCGIATRSVSPGSFSCSDVGIQPVILTITDIHGNSASAGALITISSDISAAVSPSFVQLCVGNNISFTGNPTGGSGSYSIHHWGGDNADLSDSTAASPVFISSVPGLFNIVYEVTDSNGCKATDLVSVQVFPVLTTGLSLTHVNCFNGNDGAASVSLSGGSGVVSYLWNNGNTSSALTGITADTYIVTVSDAAGCTSVASGTVSQPSDLILSASSTSSGCGGIIDGTATVVASGGVSPYLFMWSNSQTTQTATGLAPANYSVIVTDNHGCTKTAATTVTPLTIDISLTPVMYNGGYNLTCSGGSDGNINLTILSGIGPFTYTWSNGATTEDVSALPAGSYVVVVSNGFCTSSGQLILTAPPAIALTVTTNNVSCFNAHNGTASVIGTGGVGQFSYLWNTFPVKTTATINNLNPGNYLVTVTDVNGCLKQASGNITQPATLSTSGIITNLKCKGDANGLINLTVNGGTIAYSYLWNTGNTTEDRTGLKAKSYTVTVTDSHGCTKKSVFNVTEPSATLQLFTNKTNVRCYNGNTGIANVIASGGVSPYAYAWNTIPVKTTANLNNVVAGTYICNVTDANGCVKSVTIVITQPAMLVLTTSQSNVTVNGGHNGTASVAGSGGTPGYTYSWNTVPVKTTASINNLAAGNYTVKVTDSKGCSKTALVTITQPSSRSGGIRPAGQLSAKVFPNPSNGIISVQFNNTSESNMKIKVYDILGNAVFENNISLISSGYISDFDFSFLPKGVYMLEFSSGDFKQVTRLILQ